MTCIIPVTREYLLPDLLGKINRDGWKTLYRVDKLHNVNNLRNELISEAIESTEFIRVADDDDMLLPHRKEALASFEDPSIDIVYFDYLYQEKGGAIQPIRLSGNVKKDMALSPGPWIFVMRASSIKPLLPLFDPDLPCLHGGYLFLKLAKAGLHFKHIPRFAYNWRRNLTPSGINKNPLASELFAKLKEEIGRCGGI